MKLKEKFQRFWTLSKSHKGFTLVELIVVIAILAILAGVAIPVYNGYIKKAQEASDQQLLDTINTAFAAACLVNGIDQGAVGSLTVNEDGTIIKTKGGSGAASYNPEQHYYFDDITYDGTTKGQDTLEWVAFDSTFGAFYAGNESAAFKGEQYVGETLEITGETEEDGAGKKEVNFGKNTYQISESIISAFKNSVFNGKEADMQKQLNSLSAAFKDTLGDAEKAGELDAGFAAFLSNNKDMDLGNAAVLYVAEQAAGLTPYDIAQKFNKVAGAMGEDMDINGALAVFKEDESPLASIALMYGAVTAFANSDGCDPDFQKQVANVQSGADLMGVFGTLANTEGAVLNQWNAYLGDKNEDGTITTPNAGFTADMNGFLGALEVIDTVSGDINSSEAGVWDNEEITKLLNDILGQQN